ncbi:TIGR03749 family integrating conjugative element protein [Vreelandella nigrificans]|uniref:TIGR03749 family integrating conjugative element protein n=1 Tax=Vreelandella nigrificans TaxID=2042704 RepID=A0A2A4HJ07_9GAMM|nr:TIGR03749 family integrating conjugative element protein [Halomonas nigrificans]PCF94081.1 TIGR03749 family integrating conjugative element protein [Halomonas nigrificans]
MSLLRLLRQGALLAVGVMIAQPSWAVEIIEWERRPMDIPLPVGIERIVILDRNVRVGLPGPIANAETLRVQSSGGVLYLLAHEAFDAQRVQLQDVESGEILLVDLSARDGASDEDIRIVEAEDRTSQETAQQQGQESAQQGVALPPVPVALTRYAAQSLYAPMRAVETVPGVRRVPMRLPDNLPTLMPALPVTAKPLAAWTLNGYTVTAIRLTNNDASRAFELDPRWLQGEFYSASFMHPSIGPQGSVEDTTSLFVVTRGNGLAQSMLHSPLDEETGS